MTILPAALSLLTSGMKSVSEDASTKTSTGDWWSRSTASIVSRMSLAFFPDEPVLNTCTGSIPSSSSALLPLPVDQSPYALFTATRPTSETWSSSHRMWLGPTFSKSIRTASCVSAKLLPRLR